MNDKHILLPCIRYRAIGIAVFIFCTLFTSAQTLNTQVLVVGGTTGGIAAGLQCARQGVQTIIVEETPMLGGMLTAAAVSCTDGNDLLHSGMWQQFRQALYTHYGTRNLASGWVSETCFEPHVADSVFKAWAHREKNLQVKYGWYFHHAFKRGNKVTGAVFINTRGDTLTIHAAITIDATELGDVFADAGAGYNLGMEDAAYSGEKEAPGTYNIIQDATYAAVLKDYGQGADKTIAKPLYFDETKYYCSTSDAPCNAAPYPMNTQQVLNYGRLTVTDTLHPKYMLNWPKNGNDFYINLAETKPIYRAAHYDSAIQHTLGFIYFLQTKLGYKNIGLADDEVNHGLAYIPYNREGRRLKGLVRFNLNHIDNPYAYTLYRTGIAVGDYPVDHHHGAHAGVTPLIPFPKIPAFNIPLGALIPKGVDGLVVCEKGISVSNIVNGCTRLQPVVMLTGQAAGIAAAQCIQYNIQPAAINVRQVQRELLKNKCYLMPFDDVLPTDNGWQAIQHIGATGIIKGIGKSQGWENKMFFYPDSLAKGEELSRVYNYFSITAPKDIKATQYVRIADVQSLLADIKKKSKEGIAAVIISAADFKKLGLDNHSGARCLTKKELAILLDAYLQPFNQPVNLNGSLYNP